MHIGNMGLAPSLGAATSTAPPYRTGGNLDNKRIGIGGEFAYLVITAIHLCGAGSTCRLLNAEATSAAEVSAPQQVQCSVVKQDAC